MDNGAFQAILASIQDLKSGMRDIESRMESRYSSVASRLSSMEHSQAGPSAPLLPPQDSLPDMDSSNPWRPAIYAPISNGMITIEGLGTRPITDFERHPASAELPNCYVRLNREASIREDKVAQEAIIFPRDQLQTSLLSILSPGGCINTRTLPFKGKYIMFSTPEEMPNPVATKIMEAALDSFKNNKVSILSLIHI